VRDWICSGCSTRATHWLAIFASSSSMVAMCLLTIGSSTLARGGSDAAGLRHV
jgi:hypothetical protein